MFPIPSFDKVDVNVSGIRGNSIYINIVDISGRLMYENSAKRIRHGIKNKSIDISGLKKGYYILTIFDGIKKMSKSIVKI